MTDFWTASGKPFGYLTGKNLRTLDGCHIGRLVGTEIFAPDGSYLGEVAQGHYLVIDLSKRKKRVRPFRAVAPKPDLMEWAGIAPLTLAEGFEDFPSPDQIRGEQIEDLLRGYVEAD